MVTGASSGIGAGIARALANIGMKVALVARRRDRLEALAAELEHGNGEVMVCVGDVADEADVLRIFETIRARWGTVDVLVNNAGTGAMSTLEQGSLDD